MQLPKYNQTNSQERIGVNAVAEAMAKAGGEQPNPGTAAEEQPAEVRDAEATDINDENKA